LKKNLILTGMMGVGKSTIGKSLSDKLKMNFIDVDKVIEEQELMSINQIFKTKGEAYFRNIEKNLTLAQLDRGKAVIALGGGAFIDNTIRSIILKECISFWLDLDLDIIKKRVKSSKKRPLLNEKKIQKTLEKLYSERKEIYGLANYKIDCNKDNQNLIIEKIIDIYAG